MAQRLVASPWRLLARSIITSGSSSGASLIASRRTSTTISPARLSGGLSRCHDGQDRRWYTALAEPERHDEIIPDVSPSPAAPSPSQSSPKDPTRPGQDEYDLPSYLRPYQKDVILACMRALDRGVNRIGVSSPTGSGKTVML